MSHGKHLGIYIEFGHLRTTDDVFFWVFEPVQTKIAGIAAQCQKPFLNMYLESIKRYITKKNQSFVQKKSSFCENHLNSNLDLKDRAASRGSGAT